MNRTFPRGNNAPAKVAVPVKVLEYRQLDGDGPLRGFVKMALGRPGNELVIHEARHVRQTGQRAFVSPPQKSEMGPDGKRQYFPLIQWPRSWNDSIMEALERYLQDQPAAGRLFGGRAE